MLMITGMNVEVNEVSLKDFQAPLEIGGKELDKFLEPKVGQAAYGGLSGENPFQIDPDLAWTVRDRRGRPVIDTLAYKYSRHIEDENDKLFLMSLLDPEIQHELDGTDEAEEDTEISKERIVENQPTKWLNIFRWNMIVVEPRHYQVEATLRLPVPFLIPIQGNRMGLFRIGKELVMKPIAGNKIGLPIARKFKGNVYYKSTKEVYAEWILARFDVRKYKLDNGLVKFWIHQSYAREWEGLKQIEGIQKLTPFIRNYKAIPPIFIKVAGNKVKLVSEESNQTIFWRE